MHFNQEYPPASRGTIVVWGLMGSAPFGGMVWQVLHHLVAIRRLGFDVWYVQDSEEYLFHPETYQPTWEVGANARQLARWMESIGLADRWVFRTPDQYDHCVGAKDRAGLTRLYREADAVLNLCGAQEMRDEFGGIRRLVYLETDPVANQVAVASGDEKKIRELDSHHYHFTYGANLGGCDCLVPIGRYDWQVTRPPVCVDWWEPDGASLRGVALTTVANWKHEGKDVVWQGETWHWSKHLEFLKFVDLPTRSALPLQIAVGAIGSDEKRRLSECGWQTVPSGSLADALAYRNYIRESLGEFTVAKEQYVRPRSGWFSDRSVCYLAAGRPVVMQDTAFGNSLPTGNGLFSFSTWDAALAAIAEIAANYEHHSASALEIAREYFDAEKLLAEILQRVGLL